MEKQTKVLLVEDEAPVRREIQTGLSRGGFEVEDCEDGLSALKKIESAQKKKLPYNFIIADTSLPDVNGLKLLQVIKSKYPDMPVVVISECGDACTREGVKGYAGSACLDKPFDLSQLEEELKRISQPQEGAARADAGAEEEERKFTSYVFIRGKPDANPYELFNKLRSAEGVVYCDAVRGEFGGRDWDTIIMLQGQDRKSIEKLVKSGIQTAPGVSEVEVHHSERPKLGEDIESFIRSYERSIAAKKSGEDIQGKRNRLMVAAYVILEIASSNLIPLYSKLYFTDNVLNCDATDNGDTIILLIQAQDYEQVRRTIANNIRTQAGILRIKILNTVEMLGTSIS